MKNKLSLYHLPKWEREKTLLVHKDVCLSQQQQHKKKIVWPQNEYLRAEAHLH